MSKQATETVQGIMARHTPGPWRVEWWNYESFGQRSVKPVVIGPIENKEELEEDEDTEPQQDAICELYPVYKEDHEAAKERRQANAALIAAAPDLLAACEAMESAARAVVALYERGVLVAAKGCPEYPLDGVIEANSFIRAAIAKATNGAKA